MSKDYAVLRELGEKYAELCHSDRNKERDRLHRNIVGLKPTRPIVVIHEVPWDEFAKHDELVLQCEDEVLRGYETMLRQLLFTQKYFPADNILRPYIPVYKKISDSGIGLQIQEDVIDTRDGKGIMSHAYIDHLSTPESVELLKLPTIKYLKEETEAEFAILSEIFHGVMDVRLEGFECGASPLDLLSMLRGVEPLLFDLVDEPEHMHRIISMLFAISDHRFEQYEQQGLLQASQYYVHCTAALSDELEGSIADPNKVLRKNVWGRGSAQVFGSVSRDMHDEFDLQYMKELMGRFGLVYYGCCEPLDKKIDLVEQIPNLRKISITPWADVEIAAEAIGRKYVLSSKPNPAFVAGDTLNKDTIKAELSKVLTACRKNDVVCEFTLKDISTCGYKLSNLVEWEKIAMDMVLSY